MQRKSGLPLKLVRRRPHQGGPRTRPVFRAATPHLQAFMLARLISMAVLMSSVLNLNQHSPL